MKILNDYKNIIKKSNPIKDIGRVIQIIGLIIEADGPKGSIGDLCYVKTQSNNSIIMTEIVGFREGKILLMPLGNIEGICSGDIVTNTGGAMQVKVGQHLIGRVLDALGNPMDSLGEINTQTYYSTKANVINPLERELIRTPLSLGIRSIDLFATVGTGQRMGIFAGSGVGKSTTMAMIAKNTEADLNVVALIGERGREVREFVETILGPEGMKRSVVVVATSDMPSLVKIKAAFVATAIAEYFRDCGKKVLFMLDSVTRIAMAQREVGLAIGEPPATRGYTPSVFALMPKLLERAGNTKEGSITALYTVLVEGDDFNEPISDTVRSILDGHIMLSRDLAHKNHYPAVDVLQSISRVMSDIVSPEHKKAAGKIRNILATYKKNEDIINIGAYIKGSDAEIDKAISFIDEINSLLQQSIDTKADFSQSIDMLLDLSKKL